LHYFLVKVYFEPFEGISELAAVIPPNSVVAHRLAVGVIMADSMLQLQLPDTSTLYPLNLLVPLLMWNLAKAREASFQS
jgi:hypothetical protein